MGAAPRIFEKAHGRIMTMQASEGGLEKIFNQAFKVGLQVQQLKREGKSSRCRCPCNTLFDVVFSKIRDRFGGRVRFFISGARLHSTATSPSGSTRPASSSSRGTASPSRPPARS